ncbi:hypothetical protein [Rarobacter incanus]|uniref:hypothetical protein n=1 Tax=Rarobacter incanus TaxID=153494 RepID=UPI001153269C|nr:hypothetical protein [Rarobacter incanus]
MSSHLKEMVPALGCGLSPDDPNTCNPPALSWDKDVVDALCAGGISRRRTGDDPLHACEPLGSDRSACCLEPTPLAWASERIWSSPTAMAYVESLSPQLSAVARCALRDGVGSAFADAVEVAGPEGQSPSRARPAHFMPRAPSASALAFAMGRAWGPTSQIATASGVLAGRAEATPPQGETVRADAEEFARQVQGTAYFARCLITDSVRDAATLMLLFYQHDGSWVTMTKSAPYEIALATDFDGPVESRSPEPMMLSIHPACDPAQALAHAAAIVIEEM